MQDEIQKSIIMHHKPLPEISNITFEPKPKPESNPFDRFTVD
jgi:hypothetical protein